MMRTLSSLEGTPMEHPIINKSLKIIRQYWGKTQEEMAITLNVSQSYISEIEKGKREVTLALLKKYSAALNVPISTLLIFAENVEGAPPVGKKTLFVAGKALELLEAILPDEAQSEGRAL